MPINKNAYERYLIIDRCLRENEAENRTVKKFAETYFAEFGKEICERTIQLDIKNINLIHGEVIDRKKLANGTTYYSYKEKNFSILNSPLSENQKLYLKEIADALKIFRGLPKMEWIESAIAQLNASIENEPGKREIFSIENNPHLKKFELLNPLAESIKNQKVINVTIRPIEREFDEEKDIHILHPQHLKQFNRRWYLIAFNEKDNHEKLWTFAIDEIEKLSENLSVPYYSQPQNWDNYFSQFIGVTNFKENKIETIRLKIHGAKVCGLLHNNPIHPSQESNWEVGQDTMEMKLTIKENWELMNFLRRYAGNIEIISPKSLRKKYTELLQRGIDLNKDNPE
ncbi:MAG: WYL domain-containing protein [Bacteroidales bacterium]|nr:WYL domain-containing protein [Bacteroidales bacterium]